MPGKLGNTAVATGLGKVSFHAKLKERECQTCSNHCTVALILHSSKVMFKDFQGRLEQYVNRKLPDVQAGHRKGRGIRDQIANIRWIIKKAREFQKKHLFLLYWLCQSLWLWGSPQTMENSERDGNTRPPYLPLKKSVCRSGSHRLVPKRNMSRLYIVTLLI